ncbi:transcriptional regulator, HxlR family [Nannocystis exedens]|uniref:Transcriptional regulator, HxlR family n=1 Tax=Nannocystis exedens TaxID=54 RepID=A0A1I2FZ64_9BACT|nr:winged helix-turn-helix transcriptional regulator [Nannocystis exedens]PCC74587.1 HxlR family transcriptional regulator [Nannocystis exedens]SFF10622.1 transcriptional regulator, HxlR family [Nannocystis exedens]
MTSSHEKVSDAPAAKSEPLTPEAAAEAVGEALALLEGRWKLRILFHLFGGKVLRYSELERAIPEVSQKMLAQQLRRLESDGLVRREVFGEVPPRVEYRLTEWGQSLCPTLDSLLRWSARREPAGAASPPIETE